MPKVQPIIGPTTFLCFRKSIIEKSSLFTTIKIEYFQWDQTFKNISERELLFTFPSVREIVVNNGVIRFKGKIKAGYCCSDLKI